MSYSLYNPYLLTYSMKQSPSSEVNSFPTCPEIPPIFMEPEGSLSQSQVPATCPYPESARSRPQPHIPHFLKIHLNIILSNMPRYPKWSLSFRLPNQDTVYASPLPHTRYMPRQSHSSRFYDPNNIG